MWVCFSLDSTPLIAPKSEPLKDSLQFFYALVVNQDAVCTYIQWKFAVVLTVLRSFNDLLYFVHICLQFRIAYVSLESMSAGRGELVVSKRLIALNYVTGPFVGDVVALMPLPQVGNFRFRKV